MKNKNVNDFLPLNKSFKHPLHVLFTRARIVDKDNVIMRSTLLVENDMYRSLSHRELKYYKSICNI